MRLNCNFAAIVGLTNDERCLMQKHFGFEEKTSVFLHQTAFIVIKLFSNK